MEIPQFFFVVAQHAVLTDTASVISAQQNSKRIAEQIIIRMLEDAKAYKRGLEYLDENSFSIRGYGPIGDTYMGVIVGFNLNQSLTLTIDEAIWTEGGDAWDTIRT
jgi:glutamine cyclotransferase